MMVLRKQVIPVYYEVEVSQRLLDALHINDHKLAIEYIGDPFVGVNFIGSVRLRSRRTEILVREESAHEVLVEYKEFRTHVTPLFLVAHASKPHSRQQIIGSSQQACEEALLEASYHDHPTAVHLLIASNLIRPQLALHALVSVCCRGFVHLVSALIKADVKTNIKVQLGAWLWDMDTGEEFRVGAGLAEPYFITWCAVKYFEPSDTILNMLIMMEFLLVFHNL